MQLLALCRGGGTNITKSTSFNIVVKEHLYNKSFSECTDEELRQVIDDLDNNLITTADLNWKVGDSRDVDLSSFTSYSRGSASTQEAQTAQLVILNVGGKTFNGNGTGLDGQTCHYVVGFKDNVAQSYWKSGSPNTYLDSFLREVENNVYNALPADVKACFKKFNVVTGTYSSDSTSGGSNVTSQQYFTSAAEKEIFGSSHMSTSNEAKVLSQFTYYKTVDNRIHSNLSIYWWERSPSYEHYDGACRVHSNGTYNYYYVISNYGVSPFGCI